MLARFVPEKSVVTARGSGALILRDLRKQTRATTDALLRPGHHGAGFVFAVALFRRRFRLCHN